MWEKFTPGALDIIKTATKEARLSGQPAVDTSHLLFSMMRQRGDGVRAAQVLRDFDLRPEEVYSELIAIHQDSPTDGKLPLAPDAQIALRHALDAANKERFPKIGGDQILLGLLSMRDTAAAQFLSTRGITAETAQVKLIELALLEDIDFQLGQTRDEYTALARRCTRSLRRTFLQAAKIALESHAVACLPSHLLRGALLGENELTAYLKQLDYSVELLYRDLQTTPVQHFEAPVPSPATLPPSPALVEVVQRMESEAAALGDPQLSTIHLLLAILGETSGALHDAVQKLGDINQLNSRRVRERLRQQRSQQAE